MFLDQKIFSSQAYNCRKAVSVDDKLLIGEERGLLYRKNYISQKCWDYM